MPLRTSCCLDQDLSHLSRARTCSDCSIANLFERQLEIVVLLLVSCVLQMSGCDFSFGVLDLTSDQRHNGWEDMLQGAFVKLAQHACRANGRGIFLSLVKMAKYRSEMMRAANIIKYLWESVVCT